MITNKESLESFINFCNNMKIAEEGKIIEKIKKKVLYQKRPVSIKNAVDVKTESELKDEIRSETNLIHLAGPKVRNLLVFFKDAKRSNSINSTSAIINAMQGYRYEAYKKQEAIKNDGYEKTYLYDIVSYKGETYLLNRMWEIKELKEK